MRGAGSANLRVLSGQHCCSSLLPRYAAAHRCPCVYRFERAQGDLLATKGTNENIYTKLMLCVCRFFVINFASLMFVVETKVFAVPVAA